MQGKLENQIALVTGGTSGIGLATARRFIQEGAQVVVSGRRQSQLDAAVETLGPAATGVLADVSRADDMTRLFATIRNRHGRLDVVFANAGGGSLAPLGDITEAQFDATFGANVKGVLFTVQGALPLMSRGGAIVLNASTAGVKGTPAFSVYSASKAAVRNFARSWSLDLKGRGIRVNVISPGVVRTPGYDLLGLSEEQIQGFVDTQVQTIPLGRAGTPDEIARVVVFLASKDSDFMTAAEVFVDGGMTQV